MTSAAQWLIGKSRKLVGQLLLLFCTIDMIFGCKELENKHRQPSSFSTEILVDFVDQISERKREMEI